MFKTNKYLFLILTAALACSIAAPVQAAEAGIWQNIPAKTMVAASTFWASYLFTTLTGTECAMQFIKLSVEEKNGWRNEKNENEKAYTFKKFIPCLKWGLASAAGFGVTAIAGDYFFNRR